MNYLYKQILFEICATKGKMIFFLSSSYFINYFVINITYSGIIEYIEYNRLTISHWGIYSTFMGSKAIPTVAFGILVSIILLVINFNFTKVGFYTWFNKNGKRFPIYYVCPKCLGLLKLKNNNIQLCEKCVVELENIKGFIDRHPEYAD